MESLWQATCSLPEGRTLTGDVETDIAVIGGGMAGLLTAYFLQQAGRKVVVLESGTICGGMTGHTTAKITAQHQLIYHKLLTGLGKEKAWQYANSNRAAVEQYARMVQEMGIDCDFQRLPAYVYALDGLTPLEQEADAARQLGLDMEMTARVNLPFDTAGGLILPNQAQFHPLKFASHIARELTIYEHTLVTEVEDGTCRTDRGTVTANQVVFATHFPFVNVPGYYFIRMYQQRSYVVALEGAKALDGMYIDANPEGYSFRQSGNYVLLGGAGHKCGDNKQGGRYRQLETAAQQFYPGSRVAYRWSAQDCMPLDSVPYIGQYASSTPNWFVATGFQKWGMTGSMVAAMLLSDLICGRDNPGEELFSPQRLQLDASAKNLWSNTAQAVKGLSSQLFHIPDSELADLPTGHGGIVEHMGEKIGVYKDETGKCHMVSTRCTHLGCQLEWNPDEKSWDCPCHGSRFDYRGRRISGPALKDLHRPEEDA